MKIPEKSIPPALLKNTHGVAIILGVIKARFVVGGRYGQGIQVVKTQDGTWSNPVFVTITGASVGFLAGVQSTDVVLVFKTLKSIDGIIKGKVTLGAETSVAAAFYNKENIYPNDVFIKETLEAPSVVDTLKTVLIKYSSKK